MGVICGLGFRVYGLRVRVQGLGCRVVYINACWGHVAMSGMLGFKSLGV